MLEENYEIVAQNEYSEQSEQTKRTSPKQLKASLDEYVQTYLKPPKITDRQTLFISRDLRDDIDMIVRRFGMRRSSVSGFVENAMRLHLKQYTEEIERWKRL